METYLELKEFLDGHEGIEGKLTVARTANAFPTLSGTENADRYVQTLGFAALGNHWHELDRSQAVELLSRMLHLSLAYKIEMMPQKTAHHVADRFISLFNTWNSTYLSNGQIAEGLASWNPITKSTMEMALVVSDAEWIGVVCVEDED